MEAEKFTTTFYSDAFEAPVEYVNKCYRSIIEEDWEANGFTSDTLDEEDQEEYEETGILPVSYVRQAYNDVYIKQDHKDLVDNFNDLKSGKLVAFLTGKRWDGIGYRWYDIGSWKEIEFALRFSDWFKVEDGNRGGLVITGYNHDGYDCLEILKIIPEKEQEAKAFLQKKYGKGATVNAISDTKTAETFKRLYTTVPNIYGL